MQDWFTIERESTSAIWHESPTLGCADGLTEVGLRMQAKTRIRGIRVCRAKPAMCLGFVDRSRGPPSSGALIASTAAVTVRVLSTAKAAMASLTTAERLAPRRRASSVNASSSCSVSLNEAVRIGVDMVLPP